MPYRLIASGIGLDIGPCGDPAPNPDNGRRTMVRMDPRHRGLFGAAWTLASIGEAARGGVAAISPAALVGEFGIVHRRLPYEQPWFDDLGRAAVYPVYHVVAGMAQAAGRPCVEAVSSDRTRIAAAGLSRGGWRDEPVAGQSARRAAARRAARHRRQRAGRPPRRIDIRGGGDGSRVPAVARHRAGSRRDRDRRAWRRPDSDRGDDDG